jgi:hypothetical protein
VVMVLHVGRLLHVEKLHLNSLKREAGSAVNQLRKCPAASPEHSVNDTLYHDRGHTLR